MELISYLISETNPNAKQDTTQDEHSNIFRRSINGTTRKKDAATEDHGVSPTQRHRDVAGQERWKKPREKKGGRK